LLSTTERGDEQQHPDGDAHQRIFGRKPGRRKLDGCEITDSRSEPYSRRTRRGGLVRTSILGMGRNATFGSLSTATSTTKTTDLTSDRVLDG
jgi:hypothetical protein